MAASGRAVGEARALATALGAPPFLVGVALVAVGTDLPEIANSITLQLQGQGDINAGDSIGSVLTQYTLVLAVIPLLAGSFRVNRREAIIVGSLAVPGLLLSAALVVGDWLGHFDGLILFATWLVLLALAIRILPRQVDESSTALARWEASARESPTKPPAPCWSYAVWPPSASEAAARRKESGIEASR